MSGPERETITPTSLEAADAAKRLRSALITVEPNIVTNDVLLLVKYILADQP